MIDADRVVGRLRPVSYTHLKDVRYLDFVQKVADVYLRNLPADYVPYWDFNDPAIPDAPRDASAAAGVASALLELSTYLPSEKGKEYKDAAIKMLKSLSSDKYQRPWAVVTSTRTSASETASWLPGVTLPGLRIFLPYRRTGM